MLAVRLIRSPPIAAKMADQRPRGGGSGIV
jgi:hypothetical protein